MKRAIVCLITLPLLAPAPLCAAPGPKVDTTGMQVCSLHGFSTDPDPKGTNVRIAADKDATIITQLPPLENVPGAGNVGVTFEVVGSKNGWLLIRNAVSANPAADPSAIAFKGPGWISGTLVGFTIGSNELLDAPNPAANVVAQLQDDTNGTGPDSYTVKEVHACQDKAADVTVQLSSNPTAQPMRGWALKVCGNQVATCDPY